MTSQIPSQSSAELCFTPIQTTHHHVSNVNVGRSNQRMLDFTFSVHIEHEVVYRLASWMKQKETEADASDDRDAGNHASQSAF